MPDTDPAGPLAEQRLVESRLVEQRVVPVIEETAVVYKERVVTERVRLHKRVHADQETLDIPVQVEAIEVERVAIGAWVEAPPAIRQEDDTTVYPVVEEVLVVEKRLRLVEEVRVTRRQSTRHHREAVVLRREEIAVEREVPSHEADAGEPKIGVPKIGEPATAGRNEDPTA
jgi:uncharacterized protein (TIGR02271 family)